MPSNKVNFNWQKLAKKGEIEGDVRKRLEELMINSINKFVSGEFILKGKIQISSETKNSINTRLNKIFLDYSIFTENEIKEKIKRFYLNLEKDLDLLINKKACCSIEFEGYTIYNFFKSLSSLLDEIEIEIKKDKLYILTMDPLRISTIEIFIANKSFNFYKTEKLGFNLNDLQNVLKCKSNDNSTINLIFGKKKLFITIKSKKYKSQIDRELKCIDYHQSGKINIDNLHIIDYSCRFDLSKERLGYLIDNFGIYSEIINIECSDNKICFIESGDSGFNEISWDKNSLSNIIFESKSKNYENEENQNHCKGFYSLDFFNMNYKMATLLNSSDHISFSIRERFPLKSIIKYLMLGESFIRFYISPRN